MGRLSDALSVPATRRALIDDGARLVQGEVERKSGLGGLALKGAFQVARKVRPDFVREVLEKLMPAFAGALDPFVEARDREASGQPLSHYLSGRAGDVADALLSITDGRAARADHGPLRAAYEKLRPAARRHVKEAVPGIGALLDRHLQ